MTKTNNVGTVLISIVAKSPNGIWSDGIGPQEIGQTDYLSAGDKAAMAGQYGAPLNIGGRIVDAANAPLAGVQVTLSGGATYRGINPVSTDANGNYEFSGIPRYPWLKLFPSLRLRCSIPHAFPFSLDFIKFTIRGAGGLVWEH
jgi:hypothetical protein